MIDQLSVFLENRAGRLADMTRVLGDAGFNLRALSVADTAEFGVARIIVDRPYAARELLQDAGFSVTVTPVIAVRIPDRPGGISDALAVLVRADVNVGYAYAFVPPGGDAAATIFRVAGVDDAVCALEAEGFEILDPGDLYEADAS